MSRWLQIALSALLISGSSARAEDRKPSPAELAAGKALDAVQDDVGQCVLHGVKPGRWVLKVKIKAAIGATGQLKSLELDLQPAATATEKIRLCVDTLLRGSVSYPKAAVTLEREWTYASTEFR